MTTTYRFDLVDQVERARIDDHYRTTRYLAALDLRCAAVRSSVAVHLSASRQTALEASERAQSAEWASTRQTPRERAVGTIPPVKLTKLDKNGREVPNSGQHHADRGAAQYVAYSTPWKSSSTSRGYLGLAARSAGSVPLDTPHRDAIPTNPVRRVLVNRSAVDLAAARFRGRWDVTAFLLAMLCRAAGLIDTWSTQVVAADRNGARAAKRAVARDARDVLAREGLSDRAAVTAAIAGDGSWHLVNGGTLTRANGSVSLTFASSPYDERAIAAYSTLTKWVAERRAAWTAEHAEQAARSANAYADALAHRPAVSALAD